jgi:hypothetical protein
MLLQTMNDGEKASEAFRIYPVAIGTYKQCEKMIWDKFKKGTRFPYFQRIAFDDDRGNKWIMSILCKSRKGMKKGQFWCFCYTTYEIEKKKSDGTNKYDGNTGKGILAIDPFAMKNRADGIYKGMGAVMDITPHALNRYTQRYLKPNGLENIEFVKKVESMMLRWRHFDVMGDESSRHNSDKGMFPYDVFMKDGGILRGYMVDEMLVRFFSYVSDDMLHDDQREWQEEMESEYLRWVNEGYFKPKK